MKAIEYASSYAFRSLLQYYDEGYHTSPFNEPLLTFAEIDSSFSTFLDLSCNDSISSDGSKFKLPHVLKFTTRSDDRE